MSTDLIEKQFLESNIHNVISELSRLAVEENASSGENDAERKIKSLLEGSGMIEALAGQVYDRLKNSEKLHSEAKNYQTSTSTPRNIPLVNQKSEPSPKIVIQLPALPQLDPTFETNIPEENKLKYTSDILSSHFLDLKQSYKSRPKQISDSHYSVDQLPILHPGKRFLAIKICQGRAFLGEPDIEENKFEILFLHLLFGGQRLVSKGVASSIEPLFSDQWILDLNSSDTEDLLRKKSPMRIIVTRYNSNTQNRNLVGSRQIEWRHVLQTGYLNMIVELLDPFGQVSIGLLELQFEMLPSGLGGWKSKEDLTKQIALEDKSEAERQKWFYVFTKQWWTEFLEMRNTHSQRLVKIFGINEEGLKFPVTTFVNPIKTRLIPTTLHAARFVSLISTSKHDSIGVDTRSDIWLSPSAFLLSFSGDIADHAVLLCSLLLGFSQSAYVTCGTRKIDNSAYVWVTTINDEGEVWFWDSCTGFKYRHHPDRKIGWVDTIGCCFNNESFYANIQESDLVETCNFTLQDESKWKKIPEEAISSISRNMQSIPIHLNQYESDTLKLSMEIERKLMQSISTFRSENLSGCSCIWDDSLGHLLGQSIWNMEHRRLHNQTEKSQSALEEEFQSGIKRLIPEGYTFKVLLT
ncbi:Centrosomal protein of 76 kDa [Nowakowskiella sp. JEL0407]|nr:Centrosomal protein of 76 kDa [Nowakowskiella sp. JEL0407]